MEILDLLNESTEVFVEASNIGLQPDMSSIMQINNEALEESFGLEVALVKASNKLMLSENAEMLSENVFGNMFTKIKNIITKMWAKIKEFFKSVRTYFDKLVMNEGKFADKYKTQIQAISSVEIQGYDVDPSKADPDAVWKKIQGMMSGVTAKSENGKLLDELANAIAGEPNAKFKAGLNSKIGVTGKPIAVKFTGSQLYSLLSGLKSSISAVNDAENKINKSYNDALRRIDEVAKIATKVKDGRDENDSIGAAAGEAAKAAAKKAEFIKSGLALVNTTAGIKISALKLQASQAKKAAYKGIAESKKSDNTDK